VERESKYEAEGLMDTSTLKKFAQEARRQLREQVCSKLELVLKEGSLARRERANSVESLEEAITSTSKENVIDRVAYIWFNRLCAMRFMDVNHYTKIKAVSSSAGFTQPEILAEAKQGHVDDSLDSFINKKKVLGILSGSEPSKDPEQEAYRLLLVATCNYYNHVMPFLFQKIDDYSELLIPADLLSESSILTSVRKAMRDDTCQNVEVIGWLYQFYISEKKAEVINRRSVVKKDEIPAATQLFSPKWIVKYMVENSLGRLWMLNRPQSKLVEKMEYYIKPEDTETDFLKISKPEEIKVCDPACGSGHMLTYAFDLLYTIYEEEGYETNEIPKLILENNLYGIEIDERAGELAAFAMTMKAREKYKRFFSKAIQPNICVLENIQFEESNLKEYMEFIGRDLFTMPLQTTLRQFEEADNFGSLIRPDITDVASMLKIMKDKDVSGQLFLNATHQKVLQALQQADYLSQKYHVVIANPPYMGSKAMNGRLGDWLKENYPDVKSDLFSAFILRCVQLTKKKGEMAFVTPYVWMFISSYEKLRNVVLSELTITSLIQLEYNAFAPACIPVATFAITNNEIPNFKGGYVRLSDFRGSENQAPKALEAINDNNCGWFYRSAKANDFKIIPGSPIAYWLNERVFDVFKNGKPLVEYSKGSTGLQTSNEVQFVRLCHEPSICKVGQKWIRLAKGGGFRKWFGNVEHLVDWNKDGIDIKEYVSQKYPYLKGNYSLVVKNERTYFKDGLLTSRVTSGKLSFRVKSKNEIYADACTAIFPENSYLFISLLATKIFVIVQELNPTLNFQASDIEKFPVLDSVMKVDCESLAKKCISVSKRDWNGRETSFDFDALPLLQIDVENVKTLKSIYYCLLSKWQEMTLEMQQLEEENNRIFIEVYGLQNDLTPEVPLREITLTCNPHYRYRGDKTEEELEALLLADTMKEYISYAVGCMLGRYSLDKPGLILANQGETIEDYRNQIPEPTFKADDDNVIPFLDKGYFSDDVTERFYKFLKVTFGETSFDENLKFLEKAIGKDVRKYFLKNFYADHIKRYKKRPIYWMFSSPKGTFNALIYMHRYRPDTVSVVLNDYLREFRTKLTARRDHLDNVKIDGSASQREQTQAIKEIETIKKQIEELNDYEHDILYPLATQKIIIDLDDGVKVNYPKLGKALQKVVGLSEVKKAKGETS